MKKILIIVLTYSVVSCTMDDQKQGVKIEDIITVKLTDLNDISVTSVPADSNSQVKILVTLGENVSADQQVTVTADQGWFVGGDSKNPQTITKMTTLKTATLYLVADTKPNKQVGITASVSTGNQTFSQMTRVTFAPNYPNTIYITTNKEIVPPDETSFATLTVVAVQDPLGARVSDGVLVNITSSTSDSVTVDFTPYVAFSNGKATFTVKSSNKKNGFVTMTATVKKAPSVTNLKEIEFSN